MLLRQASLHESRGDYEAAIAGYDRAIEVEPRNWQLYLLRGSARFKAGQFEGSIEDFDQVTENFINGACDVITTDGSALVGRKGNQQPAGENWVIFPATPISKEPLGPTYGQNQSRFADVVNWTVYATVIADEKGITSANVADMAANPPDAEAARLLCAADDEQQSNMGLAPDAFYLVIAQVGNYDEIYSRHLNPVGLTREGSANAGWLDGGLIYAPPAR